MPINNYTMLNMDLLFLGDRQTDIFRDFFFFGLGS